MLDLIKVGETVIEAHWLFLVLLTVWVFSLNPKETK